MRKQWLRLKRNSADTEAVPIGSRRQRTDAWPHLSFRASASRRLQELDENPLKRLTVKLTGVATAEEIPPSASTLMVDAYACTRRG